MPEISVVRRPPGAARSGRGARFGLLAAAVVALVAVAGRPPAGVAADAGTLRVDTSATEVDGGETFTVTIVQDASVPTTGAQVNLVFDPGLLEVVDFQVGDAYATGIFQFGSVQDG